MSRRAPQRGLSGALPRVATLPVWLREDLRSDHAGETGAVWLYRGVLAVSGDASVRAFALEHLTQEEQHLALFDAWLAHSDTSLLLPLWRMAGWCLGALAALSGARAVYVTVDAVEQFVVDHYDEQIERLASVNRWGEVREVLIVFCRDEARHREDALNHGGQGASGFAGRLWRQVIAAGSAMAVQLARRL